MLKTVCLSIFTTFLTTSGQVLWKLGFSKIGGFYVPEQTAVGNVLRILSSPFILAGFASYILATAFFMFLVSKYDISLIVPVSSVSFVFSLAAGFFIFDEPISPTRVVGVFIIIFGILMVLRK